MFLSWELLYIKQVEVLFSIEETIVISIKRYSKLRPNLSSHLFYDPQLWYIANKSGSEKETVSRKIGENIEILILFVWRRKTGFWLISIIIRLQWINIKIKQKLNLNIYKVTFLLYQLLIIWNLFVVYLSRQKDCKKKVCTGRWLLTIFYFTWRLDRKRTTF